MDPRTPQTGGYSVPGGPPEPGGHSETGESPEPCAHWETGGFPETGGHSVPGGRPLPEHWDGDAVAWRNRAFLLFDRLPVPVALCDKDGLILMANPALAAEWGELPAHLRGRNALDLLRPSGVTQLRPIAEAVRHGRRSRYPVAVSWSAAGGVERYGEATIDLLGEGPQAVPVLLLLLRVRGEHGEPRTSPVPAEEVSGMELRILTLVASGSTTARTAKAVGLTVDGVNYHVARLCRRWDVPNRAALVAHAYVTGVLTPGAWPPAPAEGSGALHEGRKDRDRDQDC
ncbi:helix-turn-helix transcriptional regulator [Streptomyces sp. NPDC088116]|uniref:helix-turn-helix transcriptional regulator n=1 Tax=Streptomyces sp. NPDC088116 TaxID=3365825 RepID=UPI00380F8803